VRRLLPLALALALVLAGCGDDSGDDSTTQPPASGTRLAGTQWDLQTKDLGIEGASEVESWIRFERTGRVTGNDGCNQFTGSYKQQRDDGLTFGPLAGTQKACAGPADEVGRRVHAALASVTAFSASGGLLNLLDSGGKTLLTYRATVPGLAGEWSVLSVLYDDAIRSVIADTKLTARFDRDGKVSGDAGCNQFSGPYTSSDTRLRIGPLAATQRACVGAEGVDAQEAGYLAALESARRFEQQGSGLTIFDEQGRMAVTLQRPR